MKNTKLLLAIATSAALLTGCQNTHGINTDLAISSGLNAYKAATLSDADAKAIANQGCVEMDSGNKVASKSSKYGKRLAKIAKALGNNINGTPVNYRLYDQRRQRMGDGERLCSCLQWPDGHDERQRN